MGRGGSIDDRGAPQICFGIQRRIPPCLDLQDRWHGRAAVTDLGLAHLTALELSPHGLISEAARCGFRSVGLRVHPATVGGPAYPTRVGTRAHGELARLLRSEGMRLNEIEFIQLTPEIDIRA